MNGVRVVFIALCLSLMAVSTGTAENCQTIYQTDFSSDPGWITSNPTYYHWDPSSETYYADQYNINYGGNYTYYEVGYHGGSFLLEWDIIIEDNGYASALSFGLSDADMDIDSPNYVLLQFHTEDRGRTTGLDWGNETDWGHAEEISAQWSPNTWYRAAMEYDSEASLLSVDVRVRSTGQLFFALQLSNVGPLDTDMRMLHSSIYRPHGTFQCPGCHTQGRFDNVTYALDCGTSAVALDIKPGSCPNPLNVKPFTDKGKGGVPDNKRGGGAANNNEAGPEKPRAVLPVAVLGTDQFDVMNVDPATVSLEGVPVKRWSYEDVATPVGGTAEECACSTDGPDGFTDLTLKFDKAAIVEALGEVEDGETIALTLTGELLDGTLIEGTDCVVIVNGGKKPPVVTKQETLPGRFALRQNYPNPFNPVTGISFTLPQAASVRLELFNVLGQTVTTLADGYLEAGEHTVSWDGASQASGVYFYRLTAGELVGTKKMMLLK